MPYIVVRGPADPHPTAAAHYPSLEAAIHDAEDLVAETGNDREVWAAMPYGQLFIGMGCVRYVSALSLRPRGV